MLDVHILLSADTKPEWQAQCLASVEAARKAAPYAVHVHTLPGIPGHLGRARAAGYALGGAPWKCYVDDDDYVLPDAFVKLRPYLDHGVAAIFPREHVWQNGQFHPGTLGRHHLWPVRADLTATFPHADWAAEPDEALRQHAAIDPRGVLDVDDVVYVHRVYWAQRCRPLRKLHRHESIKLRAAS